LPFAVVLPLDCHTVNDEKNRFLEHAGVWQEILDAQEALAAATRDGDKRARRRLHSLYELFARGTPSQSVLRSWLEPKRETKSFLEFKLFRVHRALATAIDLRARPARFGEPHELPLWLGPALRMNASEVEAFVSKATGAPAMRDGAGPSKAAVEALEELGRFGSERTIWRAIAAHRKKRGLVTRRPHRSARKTRQPVPAR
jgi:hypothetical protein